MSDTIYRQAAIDAIYKCTDIFINNLPVMVNKADACKALAELPSAQQTLGGYNVEHLVLIAKLLEKENLPPERVSDSLSDIGRVVAIAEKEFEEMLRKAVEQCMIR